jgi:hypothetical protein
MDAPQRRAIAIAAYAIAGVLLVFFFLKPLWAWMTWDSAKGTLDFGFMKVTNRPPFPSDARSVVVGLVLPIVLGALGRVTQGGDRT